MSIEAPRNTRGLRRRDGWILIISMLCFGGIALTMFWQTFPRGWEGVARLGLLFLIILATGGFLAPRISRARRR